MSQQDISDKELKDTHFILIRILETGRCFLRGFCGIGNPEWTKDIHYAKLFSAIESIQIQIKLRDKGFIIFVDNYYKYIPIEEL